MNCEQIKNSIEQLNIEDIESKPEVINQHISNCKNCLTEYQQHFVYLKAMQNNVTPDLHPAKAASMLANASQETKATNVGFLQGFIAASVLAISVLGTYTAINKDDTAIQVVSTQQTDVISTEATIVLYAPEDLHDADLDLILPEQIAIVGFDNIQQLSWPVDLKKGSNTLSLPIRVNMDKSLEQPLSIMATLYHEENERNFKIDINLSKS